MINRDEFNHDSDTRLLHHFVGHDHPLDHDANVDILLKILDSQRVCSDPNDYSGDGWGQVRYRTDHGDEASLLNESLIIPEITCYTDIEEDNLGLHASKYGCFGISLPRHLLIKHGARPVMYIPTRSDDWAGLHGATMLGDLDSVYRGFRNHVITPGTYSRKLKSIPRNFEEATHVMGSSFALHFLAFIKPFNSELPDDDPNNFLSEREWRKMCNQKFDRNRDIRRVFVAEGYQNLILEKYPQYEPIIRIVSID